MTRPITLTIHIDAMRHNLATLRSRVGASRIWAVAKADAYGHGIAHAVEGFSQADGLAVLDLHEAQRARDAGWTRPILMIEGAFSIQDLEAMAELDLATVIHTEEQARMFVQARRVPTHVWIKLNTGMNRLGIGREVSDDALLTLANLISSKTAKPIGWMTHFANADGVADGPYGWREQAERFHERYDKLLSASRGFSAQMDLSLMRGPLSLANSAASLVAPDTHADWVRPGVALYGATPFDGGGPGRSAAAFGLKPAQSLTSEIISVQHLLAGDAVGYGSRFVAPQPMRIGVVAAGYADGYPRSAPDGTPVGVQGRRVSLIGRVSMDMITVDLTEHPEARVGSAVELWGQQVAIDEVAQAAGTIGYELMTKVTERVARRRS